MKAELQADGTLTVSPHTETEAYALRCWQESQSKRKGAKGALVVVTTTDAPPPPHPYPFGSSATAALQFVGGPTDTNGICP